MFQSEVILEGAKVIRYHLPELLGAGAEEFDMRVAEVLNSGQPDAERAQQLLKLLAGSPATAEWLADFLSSGQLPDPRATDLELRSYYAPPAGQHSPPPTAKYVCPRGDFIWYQPMVGVPVPRCRTHPDMALLRVE